MQGRKNLNAEMGEMKENEIVQHVKDSCTMSEIKELVRPLISVAITFRDTCDEKKVAMYNAKLEDADRIKLLYYLQGCETVSKPTKNDAASHKKTEHCGVIVGREKVQFKKANGTVGGEVECSYGSIGRPDACNILATIASVCTKPNIKKTKGYKAMHYNVDNELAPSEVMCITMGMAGMTTEPTAAAISELAEIIRNTESEPFSHAVTSINASIPLVPQTIEGKEVLKPIAKLGLKGSTKTYGTCAKPQTIKVLHADYPTAVVGINRYQSGMRQPAMKRLGRNAYLGVPVDGFALEHITCLYEAGVKPGDSILVISSDASLVSLVRTNFGGKVKGLGNNKEMMSEPKARVAFFDWAYYPDPIIFNKEQSFELSMSNMFAKFHDMMGRYCIGKKIMHFSPLMYYCKEFCEIMGIQPKPSDKKTKATTIPLVRNVEVKEFTSDIDDYALWDPVRVPADWQNRLYPKKIKEGNKEVLPKWVSKIYGTPAWAKLTFYEKLKLHNSGNNAYLNDNSAVDREYNNATGRLDSKFAAHSTYTELLYSQINEIIVPLRMSMLSYKGCMMYVEGGPVMGIAEAIGTMLYCMRETFRSIWCCKHISPHIFHVRFITKAAAVDKLQFNDEFSPMYTEEIESEIKQKFDKIASALMDVGEIALDDKGKERENDDDYEEVGDDKDDPNNFAF